MVYPENREDYYHQNNSPTKTYHSYKSRNKHGYSMHNNNNICQRGEHYDSTWYVPEESYNTPLNKPPHISKLRSILSETISNITKGNNLQKGESVELTLEIELVKTEKNTPTNSLVEVTIIQHNKTKDLTQNTFDKMLVNKLPLKFEPKSSTSETASQKQRNWFQRVITRQSEENSLRKNPTNSKTNHLPMNGDHGFSLAQNAKINVSHGPTDTNVFKNKHSRGNFVTILPEEIPFAMDYKKGYMRVLPNNTSPRRYSKTHNSTTAKKENSLVKKISGIFLPARKADKNKAVETAFTALKKEVDKMKIVTERGNTNANSRKRKRAPVHNLGKLVSNILVDMMDNSDYASKDKEKGDLLSLQYQSFFEPVPKSRNENRVIPKPSVEKVNLSKNKIYESLSDTCCLHTKDIFLESGLKTSNSISDCRVHTNTTLPMEFHMGDSKNITSRTRKINKTKGNMPSKNQRKKPNGDARSRSNHKLLNQIKGKKRYRKYKSVCSKKSVLNWNGHTIKVEKEIKNRIEMLIVNELQNLALKEGMECDVTPLTTTDDSTPNIGRLNAEKMSSFICELDISDKKFKKMVQSKQSSHNKVNTQSSAVNIKKFKHSPNHSKVKSKQTIKLPKIITKDTRTKAIQVTVNSDTSDYDTLEGEIQSLKKNEGTCRRLGIPSGKKPEINDVEVTYINVNAKNWSAESNTVVVFQSPDVEVSQSTSKGSSIFEFGKNNCKECTVSSGFVRKIESDDSTWKRFLFGRVKPTDKKNSSTEFSKQLVTVTSTKTAMKFNSSTSNECSSIEIELDIQDLELILKEAKQKQKADKVLISAICKHNVKQEKKAVKLTGKNSPSYTNQLLSSAAKKLEKYVKIRRRRNK